MIVWVFGRGITACLGVTVYLKIVQGGPPDTSATPAPGIQALVSLRLGSITRCFPVNRTGRLLEDLGPGGDQVGKGRWGVEGEGGTPARETVMPEGWLTQRA